MKKNKIQEKIRKQMILIRKALGLSQAEFAERLDISQEMVSQIEKGKKNISFDLIEKVRNAFGARIRL